MHKLVENRNEFLPYISPYLCSITCGCVHNTAADAARFISVKAFHHRVNGQKSVRAHVTLFYYLQAKHHILLQKSVKIGRTSHSSL